ncbi:MAG: hypothetical protein AB7D92_10375 [Sphaerochaeta sp.]
MNMRVVYLLVRAFFSGTKPVRDFLDRIRVSRSRLLSVVTTLLISIVFLYFFVLLGVNYYAYQTLGLLLNVPYLGLFFASLIGFAFQVLSFLAGGSSLLYSGKDILLVGVLAVGNRELGTSRLIISYLLHAPLYWFITLPSLIVGLWIDGFSLLYLVGGLVFLLFGPLFALGFSVLLSMGLVHLTKGKNHKMVEELISMVALVSLILVLTSTLMGNLLEDSSGIAFNYEAMLQSYGPLIERLITLFPLFHLQAEMVHIVGSQLIFLSIGVLLTVFLVVLTGGTFRSNLSYVLSNQSVVKQRGFKRGVVLSSPRKALMRRELLIIRSESMFVFEVAGELGIPLLLLVLYAAMGVLDELAEVASTLVETGYLPQITYLILLLFANIGMVSSTSVSRQGKRFYLDKQYPLNAETYVQAKLALHLLLLYLPHVLYLVLACFLLSFPPVHLLWMIPLSFLSISSVASLHLAIDYHHPHLDWKVSQQAMKSNLNGLFGMIVSLTVVAVYGVMLLLPMVFDISLFIPVVGLFILSGAGLYGSYRLACSKAQALLCR